MSENIEVTERGEIVARCIDGGVWTDPEPDGSVWLVVEDSDNPRMLATALLTRDDLAAWCRRVLRKVDPDSVQPLDEAAIRADEAERIAEWLASRAQLLDERQRSHRDRSEAMVELVLDAVWANTEAIAGLIRAGKHKSTP